MLMTKKMFDEYEDQFNHATDKSDFYDKWYAPDAVFKHPFKGVFKGKEQLVNFWNSGKNSGHAGIHEDISLTNIISIENKFSAELDITWTCIEDTDYLGPRKKGDVFHGKCAAFYTFENDKIVLVDLYLNLTDK